MSCIVTSLYCFAPLPDFRELREPLLDLCCEQELRGTLLLAAEGINGTIAGDRRGVDALLTRLRADSRFEQLMLRETTAGKAPFRRMKVKLKREIVTMGVAQVDPRARVGQYVAPADWDRLIADPSVTVVDTRNDYECDIGSFDGARDPRLGSFREFPGWVRDNLDPQRDRKVAMFCTGGIRCEKASSWLLDQGFEEVYHLRGGILAYLEAVPPEESSWRGECFVFDDRVAVDHRLRRGSYEQCYACRHPLSAEDRRSPQFVQGVSCPHCHDQLTERQRARFAERQHQSQLAAQRAVDGDAGS